ncbi:MAG: murein peptide amidase A [Planctomycetes bacterium]|nr:murein peptide amidase A [Planctomycetota bacterium]
MNKKSSVVLHIYIISVLFALAGCYQPVAYPELVTSSLALSGTLPSAPSPPVPKLSTFLVPGQYRIVGTSVQRLPILSFMLGRGPDVTFVLSTIHGNEPAGTTLVRRLGKYLQQESHLMEGRRVVFLAVANPDGMAHRSRFNANGVDLNRNFPAANRDNNRQSGATPLSEPEARVIKQLIEQYSPDRIISLHQPLACIDYDGPGTTLAVRMAQYCTLPVKKLGARPGSLGSYAGVDLGIPIITFEMRQNDSGLDSNTLWQRYGKALVAAIVYPERVQ